MTTGSSARRTTALFAWLNQVKGDESLPASAFKVAFELGQWINGEAFDRSEVLLAWPSLETVAEQIGMCERSARVMVKRLQLRGHIAINAGRGPGHSNRYTLLNKSRKEPAALPQVETGSHLPDSHQQSRKPASGTPAELSAQTGSRLPAKHSEPLLKQEEGTSATLLSNDFHLSEEEFVWAVGLLGSAEAVRLSVTRFKNHFAGVSGSQARNRNWSARARNWILDDAKQQQQNSSGVAAVKPLIQAGGFGSADISVKEWDDVVGFFVKKGHWTRFVSRYGPDPTSLGCRVPEQILAKHGLERSM